MRPIFILALTAGLGILLLSCGGSQSEAERLCERECAKAEECGVLDLPCDCSLADGGAVPWCIESWTAWTVCTESLSCVDFGDPTANPPIPPAVTCIDLALDTLCLCDPDQAAPDFDDGVDLCACHLAGLADGCCTGPNPPDECICQAERREPTCCTSANPPAGCP